MNKINVCISCDDNYARYAGVVITSVLINATGFDNLHFYILNGGISDENKNKIQSLSSIRDCKIDFVDIDANVFSDFRKITTHAYISLPAYYRLKMPTLLPDVDRIIYFDCDVIVNTSSICNYSLHFAIFFKTIFSFSPNDIYSVCFG